MAHSSLVSSDTSSAPVCASATPLQDQASEVTESTRSGAPPHSETAPVPPGLQDIRQTYQQSGLTGDRQIVDELLEANNDKSLQHIHKKVARLCK